MHKIMMYYLIIASSNLKPGDVPRLKNSSFNALNESEIRIEKSPVFDEKKCTKVEWELAKVG